MANILSWSLFPRYTMVGRHLTPIVQDACLRVLRDDATVTLETISADAFHAATKADHAVIGAEKEGK